MVVVLVIVIAEAAVVVIVAVTVDVFWVIVIFCLTWQQNISEEYEMICCLVP